MNKITIYIWDCSFDKKPNAWIQISNCTLDSIWDYINKLKINKNKIDTFYLKMREDGFTYNIHYEIRNYKRFINNLIKKFKKLENCCPILIRDMGAEKDYKIGNKPISQPYISKTVFLSPLPKYEKDMGIKRYPISKNDMKFVKYRKIKVPKSIVNKSKILFTEYIKSELKRFNLWIDKMEEK